MEMLFTVQTLGAVASLENIDDCIDMKQSPGTDPFIPSQPEWVICLIPLLQTRKKRYGEVLILNFDERNLENEYPGTQTTN